jgi:hypothetical protein
MECHLLNHVYWIPDKLLCAENIMFRWNNRVPDGTFITKMQAATFAHAAHIIGRRWRCGRSRL